jgi:hypothetical protein
VTTNQPTVAVSNVEALVAAVERGDQHITVQGEIRGMPMLTLKPGQTLTGGVLHFGSSGVRMSRDNTLADIVIRTSEFERAILNDTHVPDLGTLTLRNVRTVGQVLLLVGDQVRAGHVQVEGLHVERADLRGRIERPRGFGVDAMQGAFTLWNTHEDDVRITAELLDISIGTADAPARGSGVFVGGQGDDQGNWKGGRVDVSRLTTGEIHTDGGIADGTPDLISGGVFVITGAFVQRVENKAPVVTYGQNDMVLDNWGTVLEWTALAPITSRGSSGIGMVQFGRLDALRVDAPIETFGRGARGFNLYAGTMKEASFQSIRTHADGAIAIQVSRELPMLSVAGDVSTGGGEGDSLVKGKVLKLKASALSVKAGGTIGQLKVGGSLRTTGDSVVTVEVEGGIGDLSVAGGIHAEGRRSDAVNIAGGKVDLGAVSVEARDGERVTIDSVGV